MICFRCKHCRSINIDGDVDCKLNMTGRIKIYCENFEEKEIRGKD
ncbi:MAG: hypothetical protein QXR88_01740 [Candidatus Pacearchaeota archaeon]